MIENDKETNAPVQEFESGSSAESNVSKTSGWSYFFHFVKKHWLALLIAAAVIAAIVVTFYSIPVISINQTKIVNLGAEITLKVGETVQLKGQQVSATVEHFTVDTCPVKGQCFGTDVSAVEYMLVVDGVKYATGSAVPAANSKYQIQTVSSDYKTYVTLKLVKTNG
jgi:hypothetical protein